MRKTTIYFLYLVVFMLIIGCGSNKISEMTAVMNKMIAVQETLIKSLDNAKKVEDAASALTTFADNYGKIIPQLKKLQKKYPELMTSGKTPKELEPVNKKTAEVAQKLGKSMVKIQKKFGKNPKFLKAQKQYLNAFSQIASK